MIRFTLLLFTTIFVLYSCSKERILEREIKGKYKIEKYEMILNNVQGCQNSPDGVSFSVSNPGTLVFTGKKAIDGPDVAGTTRPFYGYFDYEYQTTDIFGNQWSVKDREYFAYDVFKGQSAAGDTFFSRIFIDGVDWDLELVMDGNKVTAISYTKLQGCYRSTHLHHVR